MRRRSIKIERRNAVKADALRTSLPFGNVVARNPALVLHEVECRPPSLLAWPPAEFSLSRGVEASVMPYIERMLSARIKLRRGQALYQPGGRFHSLYALRTGTCKSVIVTRDGHDQIIGYHIANEIVGADGIATDAHECEAIALEDMEVCPLPFDQIDDIARISDQFRRNFIKLLSRETARTRSMIIMLGTMCADQRLAVFLLDLSQRYGARGYSTHEFVLRMTRSEIGSYLGLKLETVSRLFSRFQQSGLIEVRGRAVTLLEHVALNEIVASGALDTRDADLGSGFHPMPATVRA
jgi:CRP/FNR family transcriptional regulator